MVLLACLAFVSGVAKVLLLEVDVEFYSNFGFTSAMLIAFGVVQLVGGVMLLMPKTQKLGAAFIAVTFAISTALLVKAENWPVTGITGIALILLLLVIFRTPKVSKE